MINQKGVSVVVVILIGAIVAVSVFLLINLTKKSDPAEIIARPQIETSTSSQPTNIPTSSTPAPKPSVSAVVKATPITTPATTTTTPSSYSVEAEFVCSAADEGYSSGNHVDLIYNFTVSSELNSSPNVINITDSKTNTTFELGRTEVINQGARMHSSLQNSDGNIMPFVADGRTYILKQYKLSTTSQVITKDLEPISQKSFSKNCPNL